MTDMTRQDRKDLIDVAKLRVRIAKAGVAAREEDLLAKVEEDLSAIYDPKDAAWREIVDDAQARVNEANAQISAVCEERGIPQRFRPLLMTSWVGRGETMFKDRREELRKLAQARIKAAGSRAKVEIDMKGAEALTALVAATLETEEARQWLEKIPTPAELMPPVNVAELESGVPSRVRQ
jgi:hypothetical protein